MKKIIKIIGSSIGITFNKEEQKINYLEEGDIIDITMKKTGKVKKMVKK